MSKFNVELLGFLGEKGGQKNRLVFKKKNDPSVRGFHIWPYGIWTGVTYSLPDTGNTARSVAPVSGYAYRVNAAVGNVNYGTVVGTGTNAVTVDDYNLQTKIAHGTGSGQFQYGDVTFTAPYTSGNDRIVEVIRAFTNGSGGTVTVNEIGLVWNYEGQATWYFLGWRDVLSSGVEVLDTKILTVTYKIKVTAP